MIEYVTGNIFDADVDALVNPVNCVGVMGKGLALQFKKKYPGNFKIYQEICSRGDMKTGQICWSRYTTKDGSIKYIFNFPTKDHWRDKSRYEYIETGLLDLKNIIIGFDIKSVAIPQLGCGLGGLDWSLVSSMIEETFFASNNVKVLIYG